MPRNGWNRPGCGRLGGVDVTDSSAPAKLCNKCGRVQLLESFHRSAGTQDGRVSDCRDCVCKRSAEWYAVRAADPEFRDRRKARQLTHQKKWRDANKELTKANMAEWRAANREMLAKQNKAWRLQNMDRVLEKNHRRRARLLDSYVAPVDREQIWIRDAGTCQICLTQIDRELPWPDPMSRTLDHIIPLSRGGTHEPDNIQLAHARCNSRKGDRPID